MAGAAGKAARAAAAFPALLLCLQDRELSVLEFLEFKGRAASRTRPFH